MIKRKKIYFKVFAIFIIVFNLLSTSYATEVVSDSVNFGNYVSTIDEYINSTELNNVIDTSDIATKLLTGQSIDKSGILLKLLTLIAKEVLIALRGAIVIYIIIILMGVLSSLEQENESGIVKVTYFVCFLMIASIAIKTFVQILFMFKGTVGLITTLMQVISPFLMTVLIASGAITTTGIIQPMLLFVASLVGFIVNYIVIPFICISVALNVINGLSDKLNFLRLSNLFSKTSIWIIGVVLTVFLGILSLETNITSSVDTLALKTTQAAVSNFVPVVGKFFSDSFETVIGATKIVGKVGGTLGILAIVFVTIIPIIKILSVMVIYKLLAALAEPIMVDKNILKTIDMFSDNYKTLLGILIGIAILFIISTGIVLNLSTSIIK